MALSDDLAVDFISGEVDLLRLAAGVRRRILGILSILKVDLESQIRQMDIEGVASISAKRTRVEALLRRVERVINRSMSTAEVALKSELIDISKFLNTSVPGLINQVLTVNLIEPAFASRELTALVDEQIVLGAPLSEWWERQSFDTRMRFAQQIRIGVLEGETNDQIIRRVRGKSLGYTVRVETPSGVRNVRQFAGGVLDLTTRQAETLVRTAVQSVSNEVMEQTYRENDDIVYGLQALVTLDSRTSAICMARSGGAWDINTGRPLPHSPVRHQFPGSPPWHPNCRTVLIPLLKSWEQLAKEATGRDIKIVESIPNSTRASMDGQVAGNLTFEKWLKTKGDDFARRKLGSGRFQLWKDGKISLTQLIDQNGRPLRLSELRALAK